VRRVAAFDFERAAQVRDDIAALLAEGAEAAGHGASAAYHQGRAAASALRPQLHEFKSQMKAVLTEEIQPQLRALGRQTNAYVQNDLRPELRHLRDQLPATAAKLEAELWTLEADLRAALVNAQYETAAELRDTIREVRAAIRRAVPPDQRAEMKAVVWTTHYDLIVLLQTNLNVALVLFFAGVLCGFTVLLDGFLVVYWLAIMAGCFGAMVVGTVLLN